MKKSKKLCIFKVITSLCITVLLCGCMATSTAQAPLVAQPVGTQLAASQPSAQTEETPQPEFISNISARGTVESVTTRNVYSVLGQRVEQINVREGDVVMQGQVLAVLDTEELEFAIEQQTAALALARQNNLAAVGDAQRMLDNAPVFSNNAIQDARRMLNEATGNLSNNTNLRVLHAQAALDAAEIHLNELLRSREIALQDYEEGGDISVLGAETALQQAESALISARTDLVVLEAAHERLLNSDDAGSMSLAALEDRHERLQIMYNAGFIAREELRQSENAIELMKLGYNEELRHSENNLIAARSRYNDAQIAYANATTAQGRSFVHQYRSLEQIDIMIVTAETAVLNAQRVLDAENAAARQEINMLRNNLSSVETSAMLEEENLRSAVVMAEAATSVELMEITLRQLERQLENSIITAPISGTVTAVHIREGSLASGLLFTVEDMENLRVITRFREYDINNLSVGMGVTITSDGTGNAEHKGVISRISPAAVAHSPVVEFETEILIISENTGLRLGMTTRISIANERYFTDVIRHWASDHINLVSQMGLFSGMGDSQFAPEAPMTRAMFVRVLAAVENADLSLYTTSRYDDVSTDAWYAPAVEWAASVGIIGFDNGNFYPDKNITREEMAFALANYINYKGFTLPSNETGVFADASSISPWARTHVDVLHRAGIISGKPGNVFDPESISTRAEVAALFSRFISVVFHAEEV